MAIFYQVDGVEMPPIVEREIDNWVGEVTKQHGKQVGEITYMFCDDEQILEINNQYLQHDYYTDIISFDYTEDDEIAGDLVISLDTVKSNSEQFEVDYLEELHRVIIHGVLHLCGVNDKSDEEAVEMRAAEEAALSLLKNKSEYPKTKL